MEKIDRPNRRSIRLKDYDYSHAWEYFVTICTNGHECIFGNINHEKMKLSTEGIIAQRCWEEIPKHFSNVQLDEYIILLHALRVAVTGLRLPNHVHGIIILNEGRGTFKSDIPVGANCHSPYEQLRNNLVNNGAYIDTPLQNTFHSPSNTIGAIVRGLKSTTTKRINEISGTPGIQLWQRNYYEHIIRNDRELDIIREYIHNNVVKWALEKDNPDNIPLW